MKAEELRELSGEELAAKSKDLLIAMRSAGRPLASRETPMIRPGILRALASPVAM